MRALLLAVLVLLVAGGAGLLVLTDAEAPIPTAPVTTPEEASESAPGVETSDSAPAGRHRLDPGAESTGSGDPTDPVQRATWMNDWLAIIIDPEAHWRDRQDAGRGLARFRADALPYFARALGHEHARGLTLMALADLGEEAAPIAAQLVPYLRDDDWVDTAAHALSKMGPAGESILIGALDDPSDDIRASILYALRVVKEPSHQAFVAVLRAFDDPAKDVRLAAIGSVGLWSVEPEIAVPALVSLLGDADSDVVQSAVRAIGRFGQDGVVAVESLAGMLRGTDDGLRVDVIAALGRIGPGAASATPSLVALVEGDATAWIDQVGPSLMGISPDAFVAALGHDARGVRESLTAWLAEDAPKKNLRTASMIDALDVLLEDSDADVRAAAVQAAGRTGNAGDRLVDDVIRSLDDESAAVQTSAILTLGRIGIGRTDVIESLLHAADRNAAQDAGHAIGSLGRHGSAAAVAVPRLLRELDSGGQHASVALDTLGRMGPAARDATSSIVAMLRSDTVDLRLAAAVALAHVAPPADEAAAVFEEFRIHDDPDLRRRLVTGLSGAPAQRPILVDRLGDRDRLVRFAAVWSIVTIPSERLVDDLIPLLRDAVPAIRASVADALGLQRAAGARAIPALEAAQEDKSKQVRDAVGKALARLDRN